MIFRNLLKLSLAAALLYCGLVTIPVQQTVSAQAPAEAGRITVDALKAMLAKNRPVTIIDVRVGDTYDNSDSKIKGAIRIPPDEIEARLNEIPRNREIVTYCT